MTREFNKQRRSDSRPSFRQKSPQSRYGEERTTARPRLNREIVDRGWETGAQHNHADYRPRSSGPQQPERRRTSQGAEYSSHHTGSGARRPYTNQQRPYGTSADSDRDTYRRNGHHNLEGQGRARPSGSQRANDRFDDRPYRENRPYGQSGNGRRPSRSYEQNGRRASSGYNGSPSSQGRNNHRQGQAWQSREPFYEGDYERFSSYDDSPRGERPRNRFRGGQNGNRAFQSQERERHVTRLPDGRVLKGSRPAQRKNAHFWTEVAEDTDELLDGVQDLSTENEVQPPSTGRASRRGYPKANADAQKPAKKTRTAASRATNQARGKKGSEPKPRSNGPKPSQRGFKWPTP